MIYPYIVKGCSILHRFVTPKSDRTNEIELFSLVSPHAYHCSKAISQR